MIPSEFVDELLSKVDIIDVIDECVPLKKAGVNYQACCPFHKEKTPSFTVAPTKQFYHCFGCGAHGSAIGFLMEYMGLSFVEAVENLAQRVGMAVPRTRSKETPQEREIKKQFKQSLEEVINLSEQFYISQLAVSLKAQNYLSARGLTSEICQRYGLGYAPEEWQNLAKIFTPYPNKQLIESGMVIDKDGQFYDRFRDRIMFPIRNVRGQVIAFGGRILDKGEPKYLNSPETPLFDKGSQLYGLYEAKSAIKEAQKVLVVEGYMDVVALAQFGIEYCVASLGTATTAEHIKQLMRQTNVVYFCFDGDKAGQKAAWRALENALPLLKDEKMINFLFLPTEHDPDSYVRAYGKEAFETLLNTESITLSQYLLEHLKQSVDLSTEEGKAALIRSSTALIEKINATALRFLLQQNLAKTVGLDVMDVQYMMGQNVPAKKSSYRQAKIPKQSMRQPKVNPLVEVQIRSLLINPQLAHDIAVPDFLVLSHEMACLVNLAERIKLANKELTAAQVLEMMRDSDYELLLKKVFTAIKYDPEEFDSSIETERQAFKDGMQKLLNEMKSYQIAELVGKKNHNLALSEEEQNLLLTLLKH